MKRKNRRGFGGHEKCNDTRTYYYWRVVEKPLEPLVKLGNSVRLFMTSRVYYIGLETNTIYSVIKGKKDKNWYAKEYQLKDKTRTYDSKLAHKDNHND